MDKPRIRPVEAFPIEHQGQPMICLRDPSGLAPEPLVFGMGAYFLMTLLDGRTPLEEISAAFTRRFGERLPPEALTRFIKTLDEAYYLDSPAFARRKLEVSREFHASPERPAVLAGRCYEEDSAKLRHEIEGWLAPPEGPGSMARAGRDGDLSGLIAPHIDPRRGGPAYAHAYGELKVRHPPELIVILGTAHYGTGPELFSVTRKNYATPLGTMVTEREFVDRLASRYRGGDLFADELLHRNEHAIEFQALFLAWAFDSQRPPIVPILVSSFHEMVERGISPADDPRVASFIEALGEELARERRRVLIIGGVDFAHMGRKFGDTFAVDGAVAERMREDDLALIENINRCDAEGFFAHILKDRDQRRICGLAPMYTQLRLLAGHRGRLLKYDIAMEPDTGSAVSFASLAIE